MYYDETTQTNTSTEDAQVFAAHISQTTPIEVTIQLNYSSPECTCFSSLSANATNEEVRAARTAHNDHSKRFHTAINQQLVEDAQFSSNSPDYELIMSSYSPFIQLFFLEYSDFERNIQLITSLTIDNRVSQVSICAQSEEENVNEQRAIVSSQYTDYPLDDAIDDINASDQTYNGDGVRVGIIESIGVATSNVHPELNHLSIIPNSIVNNNYSNHHALNVIRILCGANGVAPGVESVYFYDRSEGSFLEGLAWMIDNHVDVINCSLRGLPEDGKTLGTYNANSLMIDYYISHYNVTIVCAAGNNGTTLSTPGIEETVYCEDFAMANNAISVGALNADNTVAAYSSYGCPARYPLRKPTICAPGTNIVLDANTIANRTSIATPMVSGVITKLMDEFPILLFHPELVMSALVVSASPVSGQPDIWDLHAGAGRVNYEKAREALTNYTLFTGTQNGPGLRTTQQISIDPNKTIKVAFTWLDNTAITDASQLENFDPTDHSIMICAHTNYDLVITDVVGTELAASRTLYNIEILSYQNTSHENINLQIIQSQYKNVYETDKGALIWIYE